MKVRREVPKFNKDGARAKKDAVQYLCGVCGQWVGSTKISVDHIVPVVSVDEGFQDWNQFVARLFCGIDNLQVICDTCHDHKSYSERIARLIKQYTEELDQIEQLIKHPVSSEVFKLKKCLSKYTAKKKTKGLEPIAWRAQILKDLLNTKA